MRIALKSRSAKIASVILASIIIVAVAVAVFKGLDTGVELTQEESSDDPPAVGAGEGSLIQITDVQYHQAYIGFLNLCGFMDITIHNSSPFNFIGDIEARVVQDNTYTHNIRFISLSPGQTLTITEQFPEVTFWSLSETRYYAYTGYWHVNE